MKSKRIFFCQFLNMSQCILAFILWLICGTNAMSQQLHTYVAPRIGSVGVGRTFIGPCAPFGMVKPGPDCVSMPNAGWAPTPEPVKGFSQTHVSGTGGGQKYGNILLQPIRNDDHSTQKSLLLPDGSTVSVPLYASGRTDEEVGLGYYSCTFDNGIRTEVTTSERCALYRFSGLDGLLVDVASFLGMDTIPNKREAQQYVGSFIELTSMHEIVGYSTVRGGWNNGDAYTVYFAMQSDVPFRKVQRGENYFMNVWFGVSDVNVKVGISYVSIDQARRNIVPNNFDAQHLMLKKQWDEMLAHVPYHGTNKEMRMFYTGLYHTLLMPVDKTNENPKWQGGPYYDDYYALWDTYRTSMPLLMEYYPDRAVAMINSLLAIYQHEGYMPDARSGDCNGRTQGGSHGEVVIAEAFARGLKGIDYNLALQAMLKDAEVSPEDDEKEGRGGLEEYNRLGYIPYGIPRAGTRTVEYSYDDWCIAQVARGLGRNDLYHKYLARSGNWRNLWREDYEWQGMRGFIMPRDADGQWLDSVPWGKSKVYQPHIPYKPDTKVAPWYLPWWNTFFYEALSAEYSLSVPHDVPGLIALCGGDSAFRKRLDVFFANGHYNVGNEPSFLTPYLYHYIGRSDLSARRVSEIVNQNFFDAPDGLPGNDDSGAMSAWLVWAMLGKYPVAGQNKWLEIPPVRINTGVAGNKEKQKDEVQPMPPRPTDSPIYEVHYTLNRQYRTWEASFWKEDTAWVVNCNGCLYTIPTHAVEHATGFSWDSPQRPGAQYLCDGTFLFISQDAMNNLLTHNSFVYNGITWREQERTEHHIRVKADVDNTEMWIARNAHLPFVMKMKNNPLGIDWYITINTDSVPADWIK